MNLLKSTFAVALLVFATPAIAQPLATSAPDTGAVAADRWLILCCGLPGDDEHRERLTGACEKIIAAAQPVLGVDPNRLRVLAGDEAMRESLDGAADEIGVCTRESVAEAIAGLAGDAHTNDGCWIILLGHSHLYDTQSSFNVLGPDFDQAEFARWAEPLACREQVFWLTMPISGFWIKPLAGDGRVIISATEADLEFTGTEMPYALADVLSGDATHQKLDDVDGDAGLSLLDLYLATCLEVDGRFRALERLQTEHAQLEDNGDGRGSEFQRSYLPVPQGEQPETPPQRPEPVRSEQLDGFRARHIILKRPR